MFKVEMSSEVDDSQEVGEDIRKFLKVNFPQIKMHGGDATITEIDLESKSVVIQLGGACSGCGISPMTIDALKQRLPKEIPEIETVHASTGEQQSGMNPTFSGDTVNEDEQDYSAPF